VSSRILGVCLLIVLALAPASGLAAGFEVREVDFLQTLGLDVNGAGPLLVRADSIRHRVVLVHTLTASVSLIDTATDRVQNIATGSRVPQFLKDEALAIHSGNGNIFVIADHALVAVFPETGQAVSIPTGDQFESLAIDEATETVYLVSRASAFLAAVDVAGRSVRRIPWLERTEPFANLNATPPPPPRKVFFDPAAGRAWALDAATARMHEFDPLAGQFVSSRPLDLAPGGRWHLAGPDRAGRRVYLVVETAERKVIQAARLALAGRGDQVVSLPGLSEGVGITRHPVRDELYLAYDNDPSLHVVSFGQSPAVAEVALPMYGNDAVAIDPAADRLYVASWALGEVEVVDLAARKFVRRFPNLGIIPHMFSMAWDASSRRLFIPLGASAVNGSYGSAVTALDPASGKTAKIRTGWPPRELIVDPAGSGECLVFNSEDEMAVVQPGGSFTTRALPCAYPLLAAPAPDGKVYLAYGPHQSYWPVVYIWGAKNGLLHFDPRQGTFADRRLPRQPHAMALDKTGALYLLQNNWGREKQFLTVLEDPVREFLPDRRIVTGDEVETETTQRLLAYDADYNRLYVVRTGESNSQPGVFQASDLKTRRVMQRLEGGRSPTDLLIDGKQICVVNYGSDTVTLIDRDNFLSAEIPVSPKPFRIAAFGDSILTLHHGDNSVVWHDRRTFAFQASMVPGGLPIDVCSRGKTALLATVSPAGLNLLALEQNRQTPEMIHRIEYPYGDVRFDSGNTAFFLSGEYGDSLYRSTALRADADGRFWVADFLSGRLFILTPTSR